MPHISSASAAVEAQEGRVQRREATLETAGVGSAMLWKYSLKSSKDTGVSPSLLSAWKILVVLREGPPLSTPMRASISARVTRPSPSLSKRLKAARKCLMSSPRLEGSSAATKRENSTTPSRAKCVAARLESSASRPAFSIAAASSPASSMPSFSPSMEPKSAARPRSSPRGICEATSSSTASSSALMPSKARRQSSFSAESRLARSSRSQACASTCGMEGRRRSSHVSMSRNRSWASGPPRNFSSGAPCSWRCA
mmetsp:Transcript_11162/g.34897  ORF Transcript_11162/g.34897 Transcript_11162/m.34897 type:complete len:255 (+) Transcript_11162:121-885(+)